MGAFVSNKSVKVTVEGRPDEYIEIVAKLGVGALADLQNKLVKWYWHGDENVGTTTKVYLGDYKSSLLEVGVINWRLKGRSLDLNDELVCAAIEALEKLNKHNLYSMRVLRPKKVFYITNPMRRCKWAHL